MFHVVLVEPQIPPNTGNIGRLCVALESTLHLIHPLGFSTDESALKRAGLDYWQHLDVKEWENLEHFWENHPINERHFFLTTKARHLYWEAEFQPNDYFYFGREDAGLSEKLLQTYPKQILKIPQSDKVRSINQATAVGIVLYEAKRQVSTGK